MGIKLESHSRSINCPHCGEEFGIESECESERRQLAQEIREKLEKSDFILRTIDGVIFISGYMAAYKWNKFWQEYEK